jgi:hypothetical protein
MGPPMSNSTTAMGWATLAGIVLIAAGLRGEQQVNGAIGSAMAR